MDLLLLLIGFICMVVGLFGSFLPVLPGPPISWVGLLLLTLCQGVPDNWWFIGITGVVALVVVALDYLIPAMGTKKFGGSKSGMVGTTVGLLIAIVFPVLGVFGIIIWPFVGAVAGELINKANHKDALKAAFGSFIGFLTGTFLKFVVCIIFLGLFLSDVWEHRAALFPWFD